LLFAVVLSCESPEADTNYTPAEYEFPTAIVLGSGTTGSGSFSFTASVNGGGEGYYVVVDGGSDAPSNNDVFSGDADGLIQSGSFPLNGDPIAIQVDGLCNNSTYDIYAVQLTSDSFLSSSPTSFSITTNTIDISGTYTGSPFAFGEDAPQFTAIVTLIDGTTNQFTIDTGWGPNFVMWATGNPAYEGAFAYSGIITLNTDNSITFVGDDGWSAIGGSGEFNNSCINEFSYTLEQELFSSTFTVDVVLRQNQQ